MSDQDVNEVVVNFKLVGAVSYSTLKKAYKAGEVYSCTQQEWQDKFVSTASADGTKPMFEETDEPSTEVVRERTGIVIHDSKNDYFDDLSPQVRAGLEDGTLDTGSDLGNEDEGLGEDLEEAKEPSEGGSPKPKMILRQGPRNAALKSALAVPKTDDPKSDPVQV